MESPATARLFAGNSPGFAGPDSAAYYAALGAPIPLVPGADAELFLEVAPEVAARQPSLRLTWRAPKGQLHKLEGVRLYPGDVIVGPVVVPGELVEAGIATALWELTDDSGGQLASGKVYCVAEPAATVVDLWGYFRLYGKGFFADIAQATGTMTGLWGREVDNLVSYWPTLVPRREQLGQISISYDHPRDQVLYTEHSHLSDDTRLTRLEDGKVTITYQEQSTIAGGLNLVGVTESWWLADNGLYWEILLSNRASGKLALREARFATPLSGDGDNRLPEPVLHLHGPCAWLTAAPVQANRPLLLIAVTEGELVSATEEGGRLILKGLSHPAGTRPLSLKSNGQLLWRFFLRLVTSPAEALDVLEGLGRLAFISPGTLKPGQTAAVTVRAGKLKLRGARLDGRKIKLAAQTGIFEQPLPPLKPGAHLLEVEFEKNLWAPLELLVTD